MRINIVRCHSMASVHGYSKATLNYGFRTCLLSMLFRSTIVEIPSINISRLWVSRQLKCLTKVSGNGSVYLKLCKYIRVLNLRFTSVYEGRVKLLRIQNFSRGISNFILFFINHHYRFLGNVSVVIINLYTC